MVHFRLILITLLFILLPKNVEAQLDLEHWFPPFLHSSKGDISEMYIYLSTDKDESFKVNLYKHNVLLKTFFLSKNEPVIYQIEDDSFIRSTVNKNTMKTSDMGFHLAGEKSFYASLRIYGVASEMISSKGKSALGKIFYIVNDKSILYDPDEPNGKRKFLMNYQASLMAIEDNTHIKISNYDKRLTFANGDQSNELNIVLNKGDSYIVAAIKSDNVDPNRPHPVIDDSDPNFIGAKITSDKKIIVNNGNVLSQGIGEPGGNINLDQTLPVDKLGKEYFIANGLTFPEGYMEKMIMVATEDNTEVYLNNQKDSFIVLNEGEYYIGPGPQFKYFIASFQPSFTNTKNRLIETKGIYLKSSKPIYVFQMAGGYQDWPYRLGEDLTPSTSTMMLSYPLDKNYLPDVRQNLRNTVVIPQIDKLSTKTIDRKITIKTEDGADIFINGKKIPSDEFSPITGKSGWSYWSRFQLNGDFEVKSNKSINVDYIGGYQFSGLSGSFTGFSNDPFIIKNGNCIQETVILTLNNTDFDKIQWQLNGVDIPGANSSIYTPNVPGSYTCALSYMDFVYTTAAVQVDDCPYIVSTRNIGNTCYNKILTPSFTPPNENLTIEKVEILTQPMNGNVIYQNNKFNIIPDNNFSGQDRFVYKITASNNFYEIVKIDYKVLDSPIGNIRNEIYPILVVGNENYFNFNKVVINSNNEIFEYYVSEEDANKGINKISTFDNYLTYVSKKIFVRITNINGCVMIKNFNLIVSIPSQQINISNFFSPNGDGINDMWNLRNKEFYKDAKIQIFDRFGKIVANGIVNDILPWNGKLNNFNLPTDTYWFIIKDDKETLKSGYVILKNK